MEKVNNLLVLQNFTIARKKNASAFLCNGETMEKHGTGAPDLPK